MSGVTVLKRQCHKIFCFIAWSPISFPRVLDTDDKWSWVYLVIGHEKNQQNICKKNCRRNQFVTIRIQKTSFYVKLERGVERTKRQKLDIMKE